MSKIKKEFKWTKTGKDGGDLPFGESVLVWHPGLQSLHIACLCYHHEENFWHDGEEAHKLNEFTQWYPLPEEPEDNELEK